MPKQNQLKNKRNAAHVPAISYQKAKESFFIHNIQAHAVATCPSHIFRSAVLVLAPAWRVNEEYSGLLASPEIDIAIRWFLLCSLAEAGKPMQLYASKEGAERALKVGV